MFLDAERFLEEAIASVLAQTSPEWELILVDDGSTDRSAAIAKKARDSMPARCRYIHHPGHANFGISRSRNVGMDAARGEYLAFLDSDDVWLPDKLNQQMLLMDRYPEATMAFGAAEYWHAWHGSDRKIKNYVPDLGVPGDRLYLPPSLSTALYPLGTATAPCPSDWIIRRRHLRGLRFEDSFADHQLYEDQAFLAKVYLREPVYISTDTWIKYRFHDGSCSSAAARDGTHLETRRYFLDWLGGYLRQQGVADPAVWDAHEAAIKELRVR